LSHRPTIWSSTESKTVSPSLPMLQEVYIFLFPRIGGNESVLTISSGFSERFIHSEIYKAYPGVQAVVHSHSLEVVPFSISSTPLRACFHMAGFLGTVVPVWDAATVYKNYPEDNQDMLVKNTKLGAALAQSLGSGTENGIPKHPVVLMRGHGFVATSNCIEMAVLRSVYTAQNAKVQRQAIALGGQVQVFTEREAHDTGSTTGQGAVKPWPLWVAEVTDASLYQNRV
jgi:ribulose-5-phosphate 4-epimerase/fuculose-1-phosphate aldolase